MKMIKNYYYLSVGILLILSSYALAWRGQTSVLLTSQASEIELASNTTIFYSWQMIVAGSLIFGVAFIVMSFYQNIEKIKFAAWGITTIIIIRLIIIVVSTLFNKKISIAHTLTESIVILVFVGLIILGFRKKQNDGILMQ